MAVISSSVSHGNRRALLLSLRLVYGLSGVFLCKK